MNTNKGTKMRLIRLLTTLCMASTLGVVGCAEPVEEVNTVQPDYIDKALFQGEWYYRQTMVDVSPEVAAAFVGMEADIERIRWEIRHSTLFAYRVHEAIPGLDESATRPGAEYQGDTIAAFPITSHFDIKRTYNTSTGEQTNVIGENTTDRHWAERQFMRIDWSGGALSVLSKSPPTPRPNTNPPPPRPARSPSPSKRPPPSPCQKAARLSSASRPWRHQSRRWRR